MKALQPLALPCFWLVALPAAAACLLVDALAWPVARLRRRRAAPAAPGRLDASIIVLNYDGAGYLRELLPSLQAAVARCPGDHEVIVVDNGSRDESRALLAREFPWVRVVALPENRFFIRGNRAGVDVARHDVLVFVNNDMRVEPDFLRALLDRFGAADLFAVTSRIEMAGARVETGCTRLIEKRGALRQEQVVHEPDGGPVPVAWAGGGSSAFDRRKFSALGGFETLYEPCYAEDLSLSYLAWKRGWRVEYVHDSVVHHAHRGTSLKVFGRKRVERLDRRNRELFFWRCVTDPGLVLRHALWAPWNAWKTRRQLGTWSQLGAVAAALARLPHALWLRARTARHNVRRDVDVLALSSHVARYRRAHAPRRDPRPRLLVIGTGAMTSPQLAGVVSKAVEIDDAPGPDGASPRERVRRALAEHDHDAVLFAGVAALRLALPFLEPTRSAVLLDDAAADTGTDRCDGVRAWTRDAVRADPAPVLAFCRDAAAADFSRPPRGSRRPDA